MTARGIARIVGLAALAALAGAEIIDRIAVTVGNRVITVAGIDREIRVTAFLEGQKLDLSAAAKRAAADRMVEQKLIQRELETARYPVPSPESIDPVIADFKKRTFKTEEEYRQALARYGISESDVREEVLWQRTLLAFVGVRFQPGVQLTSQEIQDYFDKVVAPIARAANPGTEVTLDNYRDQIADKLTGDRANQEMLKWLDEARKRTDVVYHEEVFR